MDIPHQLFLFNHQDLYAFGELVVVAFSRSDEKGFMNNVIEMLADLGMWYKEGGVFVSPHTFLATHRAEATMNTEAYASKLAIRALGMGRPFTTTQCALCIKACIDRDSFTDILASFSHTRKRSTDGATRSIEDLQKLVRKEWSAMFYERKCPHHVTLYANPGPHVYVRASPTPCAEPTLVMELCSRIPKALYTVPRARTAVDLQRTLSETRRTKSEPTLFSII